MSQGRANSRARRATMFDIARRSGVSQPTVSDVLNGKSEAKGIAAATRDRVLAAARQLHFRRNGIARRLSQGRTNLIGLVLPYIAGWFFAEITFALEMAARRRGYHVVQCHSYGRREREEQELDLLLDLCVDGLIVAPAFNAPAGDVYAELQRVGVPLVFLDGYMDGVPAHFVGTDDVRGGYLATRHLVELGHRRIAHLAGPQQGSGTRDRCQGYRNAMVEAKFSVRQDWIVELQVGDLDGAQRAVTEWLAVDTGITAIFAASDTLAAGAVAALRQMGKRVPEDVAVVGYANLRSVAAMGLRLTTVNQPTQAIGRAAADLVLEAVARPAMKVRRLFLEPQLIVRDSCGAPYRTPGFDTTFWQFPPPDDDLEPAAPVAVPSPARRAHGRASPRERSPSSMNRSLTASATRTGRTHQ